ncbi:MAG: 16S rRNA (cytosine(1402)-N(4))-methyltransferase RsmH [Actinobacteria bacterium]|nr:16S rRNA (cytosine(1402)-N(4))-methyltransferase RsmH [Actinomycetota bacterium]
MTTLTSTPLYSRRKDRPTCRRSFAPIRRPLLCSLSEHTMEGPYSARLPLSPAGEKSRRATVFRGAAHERTRIPRSTPPETTPAMDAHSSEDFAHRPVMAVEITDVFARVPAGWVIDATLGGAGHSVLLLEAHSHLKVLGIDQDPDALEAASARLEQFGDRARTARARFDALATVAQTLPADELVVGVLFDLGVSSPQLDRAERGFSYRLDAPLDMRMDPSQSLSAAIVANDYEERDLARVLRDFGDEKFATRIAHAIVTARPVSTTGELAELVRDAIPAPARRRGGHPAKRTFQAIRIEVNAELEVLPVALRAAIDTIGIDGCIAVLSYHSGEDRIVKQVLREAETGGCTCPATLPCVCGAVAEIALIRRGGLTPGAEEIAANPRSESARLRVARKLIESARR